MNEILIKTNRYFRISFFIYAIGLLIWVVFKHITGDRFPFILVVNFLGIWLFAPLLFYLPWVIVTQRKLYAIWIFIPVCLLLLFYSPFFFLKPKNDVSNHIPITLITFNTQGVDFSDNSFLENLEQNSIDILAFQEVSWQTHWYINNTQFERYPYQIYDGSTGLGIYSKYPITIQLNIPSQHQPFQSVLLNVDGSKLHLINAHLAQTGVLYFFITKNLESIRNGAIFRSEQITQINKAIDVAGFPAIVACDCNMTDLTNSYRQITSKLQDAYRQQGWGLGHTFLIPRGFEIRSKVNLPFQRIDYIFNSPELSINWINLMIDDTGSDHRPLWGQFGLKP